MSCSAVWIPACTPADPGAGVAAPAPFSLLRYQKQGSTHMWNWLSRRCRDRRLRDAGFIVGTLAYQRALHKEGH